MKLAVLSDIHGNWPALEAVMADVDAWGPDLVLVDGDVVNSGPSSDACWRAVRERREQDGWVVLAGNHEAYVTEWATGDPPLAGPAYDLIRLSHWTYRQLGREAGELAGLPERWEWRAPDASLLVALHASVLGNRTGIYPFTGDDDARRRVPPEASIFITAHTHIPHQRRLDGRLVVNVGAVGVPGDGDRQASYGRLTWTRRGWSAAIQRVAYDLVAAERAYFDTGFLNEVGPEGEMSLVEWRLARDVRTRWSAIYREAILAGAISHAAAVDAFLDTADLRPYRAQRAS